MKNVFAAALMFAFAGPAFADGVDQRQERQEARVEQGVKSGELTAREAGRLEVREQHVDKVIARDRADGGGLSAHERAKIQRKENRASRAIYRQKHDAQKR